MITEDQQVILDRSLVIATGCWLWQLSLNRDGYGVLHAKGKHWKAHIFSYVSFIGPVPKGLELDHGCRVRACANPWHVEPVTHVENVLRGYAARGPKYNCINGHEFTIENTYLYRGKRRCKACNRGYNRELYSRKVVVSSESLNCT